MSLMIPARRSIWLAMVITPLLTPFAFFVVYAAYSIAMNYDQIGLSWVGSLVFMCLFGIPVGYFAMVTLGWPWIAGLIRWKKLNIGYVCGGASIIGIIVFVLFSFILGSNAHFLLSDVVEQFFTGFVIGLLSGLIFCAVAGVSIRSKC